MKVNTVLIRGVNDDEVADFAAWTRDMPVLVRFIEFMPYRDNGWTPEKVVPGLEIAGRLARLYPQVEWFDREETDGVASIVRIPGHKGALGFINPMTNKFCSDCDRVRLTADGRLRLCLFSEEGMDLRTLLRGGFTDRELGDAISDSVFFQKPASQPEPSGRLETVKRRMAEVGG